jgi:2-polyprenyl-6-methoxyphenol hydroxylase-like FAD-dependent oxidoreductase
MTSRLQVLIVGAGPIGLTLACHLKRLGLSVRVIEKRPGPSVHSKRSVSSTASQRRWHALVSSIRFVEQGGSPTTVNIYAGDHRLVQLRFEAPVGVSGRDAFSPRAILIPQSQTEGILIEYYRDPGELRGCAQRGAKADRHIVPRQVLSARVLHGRCPHGRCTRAFRESCMASSRREPRSTATAGCLHMAAVC